MPDQPRALLLSLSGIGNLLMQLPAIRALKRAHPEWHVTLWVAPRGTRSLAQHIAEIDEVVEETIKRLPHQHVALMARLRSRHYHTGLVFSPGQQIKSALYLRAAGIPQRIGNTYPWLGHRHSSFLLTDPIPEDPTLHDIEQNILLLQPFGIPRDMSPPLQYSFTIPATAHDRARKLLNSLRLGTGQPLIGFHPGSALEFGWKRWPVTSFAELGQKLRSYYRAHLLLFGSKQEQSLLRKLARSIGNPVTVIDQDLITVAALLHACSVVVSNDSGLMHLSAAVGTQTFGLFGPTDERHTGPRGKASFVVRAPGTQPVYNTETNYNVGVRVHPTLTALTPELVFNTIQRQATVTAS